MPNITHPLVAWQSGNKAALDEITPAIYQELHRLAERYMRGDQVGHTLQATTYVNEAYRRLVDAEQPWKSRAHFLGVAAQMMRRILVDHARARGSAKRGANKTHVNLDEATWVSQENDEVIIELDDALIKLAKFDERK